MRHASASRPSLIGSVVAQIRSAFRGLRPVPHTNGASPTVQELGGVRVQELGKDRGNGGPEIGIGRGAGTNEVRLYGLESAPPELRRLLIEEWMRSGNRNERRNGNG